MEDYYAKTLNILLAALLLSAASTAHAQYKALVCIASGPPIEFSRTSFAPAEQAGSEAIDTVYVPITMLAELADGSQAVFVRTINHATGAQIGSSLNLLLPALKGGAKWTKLLYSRVFRPGSLLVLGSELSVLEFPIAFAADGTPVLLTSSNPFPVDTFKAVAHKGTGTALGEAPNPGDPESPYLTLGTSVGELLIKNRILDPVCLPISAGPISDLNAVPQVGYIAIVAVSIGRVIGVDPAGVCIYLPTDEVVTFDLADPRSTPLTALAAAPLTPTTSPIIEPDCVPLIGTNNTREVARLELPAKPTIGGRLTLKSIDTVDVPVRQPLLGSLFMLTEDGSGAFYDPGFTNENGFSQTRLFLTSETVESVVAIDIKPGSSPNTINLGSQETLQVAILSSPSFDATSVDPLTVTLASTPIRLRGNGTPSASYQDVNRDGRLDLFLYVNTEATTLSSSDTDAVLQGRTRDGLKIRGFDSIRVVP